jgi:hypothetical protein
MLIMDTAIHRDMFFCIHPWPALKTWRNKALKLFHVLFQENHYRKCFGTNRGKEKRKQNHFHFPFLFFHVFSPPSIYYLRFQILSEEPRE